MDSINYLGFNKESFFYKDFKSKASINKDIKFISKKTFILVFRFYKIKENFL